MKVGCLLIHGFTGAPYEVLPLGDYLESLGYEIEMPTLSGHGGDLTSLRGVSYKRWIEDAERAFNVLSQRCDAVVVVGFSMGGLLAINLACKHKLAGLVTLSTPIFVYDLRQMALNLLAAVKLKDYQRIKEYAQRAWETPLSAARNFQRLLSRTKQLIPQIRVPVLIVQGKRDDTVKAKSADYIYNKIGSQSKDLHYLPESTHLVCLGPEQETVFQLLQQFVTGIEVR
jgi:carboxylesterase